MKEIKAEAHAVRSSRIAPARSAPAKSEAPTGSKAISRAAHILRLIARDEIKGIRLTQLAVLTGIPHPTVRRILKCLIQERLVLQDADTRRYRLGPLNFELGLATFNKPEFQILLKSVLSQIAAHCEDNIYFMFRSGADAVCFDRVIGTTPVRGLTLDVGGRRPLGFGAAGLALLAQCPDDEVEAILEANQREIDVHKRLSRERMLKGVALARTHGYAVSRDVTTMGVVSVGAVLPTHLERSPFAVSISFPIGRATPDHIEFAQKLLCRELPAFSDNVPLSF
jgi:DNA-binding IclR family transcriptional regulator